MNPRSAALRFIGQSLAPDPGRQAIESLQARIASHKIPWKWVTWLANRYLVTPALFGALRANGLSVDLPDDFCAYIGELHRLNQARNQRLKEQTREAVRALNALGIEPLLLKGAAHLFGDTFRDTGARVMTDLDLLVPTAKFDMALAGLGDLGYRSYGARYQHYGESHHAPPLFRPGDHATLELHRQALPAHFAELMPDQSLWSDTIAIEQNGLGLLVLGPTSHVMLNIIHSQIIDRHHAARIIDLRQIHDLVMICHAHPHRVDWLTLSERFAKSHHGEVLHTYLYLAHRLFAMPSPPGFEPTEAEIRHYRQATGQINRFWFALDWITRFERLWHSLSAASIRGRYGDDGRTGAILRGRLQFLTYMLKKHAQD